MRYDRHSVNLEWADGRQMGMRLFALIGGLGATAGMIAGATLLRPGPAESSVVASMPYEVAHLVHRCPGGGSANDASHLRPGDRVYVVGRDGSGDWLALRDPVDVGATVWIAATALGRDRDVDLPILDADDCGEPLPLVPVTVVPDAEPEPVDMEPVEPEEPVEPVDPTVPQEMPTVAPVDTPATTAPTATPPPTSPPATSPPATPPPATAPPATPPPTAPPDTTAPVISQVTRSTNEIFAPGDPQCPVHTATIEVAASDNVGVTAVTGTYEQGLPGSPLNFSLQGGTWRATFGPFPGIASNYGQAVTITVRARDATGNLSNPAQTTVLVWGSGMCIG